MKNLCFVFLFLFVSVSVKSQSIYLCRTGEITFFSKAALEDIDAKSESLNSVLNIANNEIVFFVPMRSFKFKKAMMQEHFNEKYVESDKYPNATYKGKINTAIDYSKDGEYEITATGTFVVHGVEKQRTDKGRLIIKDGTISIQSEFIVALKDHNIKIPKLLTENIAETVKINFSINYNSLLKEN
ncbi:MAG: YceI family protein [Bacteroidia bacterium]